LSHFTTIKLKLRDVEILVKALKRMGLQCQEGDFKITHYGKSAQAQIKLDNAVGLAVQEDGSYAMVGDFYHSGNKLLRKYYSKTNNFVTDISTAYAIEEAITRLEEKQFYCVENAEGQLGEDNLITMVFENWS